MAQDQGVQQSMQEAALRALQRCCAEDLERVLLAAETEDHYGVPLCAISLAAADYIIADALIAAPKAMLSTLESVLPLVQEELARNHPKRAYMAVKPNAHLRLHSLPYCLDRAAPLALSPGIARIGSAHLGKLVAISGTVVRTGPVKMFESQKLFECSRCNHRFTVNCELDGGEPEVPMECPSGEARPCLGSKFAPVADCHLYTNHQEIKVQERMQCLAVGSVPSSISVLLQDEMADSCQPGDDIEVTGIVTARWRPFFPGCRCDADIVVHAVHLRVASSLTKGAVQLTSERDEQFRGFWAAHATCPLRGRNKILASICPQIFGMFLVKLATALMLIGGLHRVDDSGTHIRGEVHMLLIGDPGTGKSQVMKFAARLSPRAVVTTGRGTSGAGLTVAAVKEGGQWTLEAGALVLADGGLCCIDEFDGIKEGDRAALHEAMEQQTLHVAKAGLVTMLSTRTSVLGVTNPKGIYNPSAHVSANTSVSGPLLSRFDCVLVLLDTHHAAWDEIVSEHVLAMHQQEEGMQEAPPSGWPVDVLREYMCWARLNTELVLSGAAEAVLLAYYQLQRRSEERSAARTTIRMLESLVRLSQAHARLMARPEVTLQDAVMAIILTDCSMQASSILGCDNVLYSNFVDDPDAEYQELEQAVLGALGLTGLGEGDDGAELGRGF